MSTLLDIDHIALITDGDKSFLKQLVDIYRKDCEERLVIIKDAINNKNASVLYREAHTFKGASSNLGAIEATKLSESLESLGREDRFENCENLYEDLEESFKHTLVELEDLVESPHNLESP